MGEDSSASRTLVPGIQQNRLSNRSWFRDVEKRVYSENVVKHLCHNAL
jgi:hypothetical protein